jgi:hypothetical protein
MFLFTAVLSLSVAACTIPEAGFKLGVPYRAQETSFYCAPACVQMWRAYDGLTPVYTQQYLFEAMNGTIGCGASAQEIESAVLRFTQARDAFYDQVEGANEVERDGFFSRQVTSIDSRTPVMVLAHQHAIVVNGGKWHRDAITGFNVWDFVWYHDPELGANLRLGANAWLQESCDFFTCGQIVSENATEGWEANLNYLGGDLVIPGNPRHGGPPPV